jgi:triphosphoribosyl-dephospho-CoA synthase
MPDVGLCAQLACIWEATARKAGNVHRFADFTDVTYLDFLLSGAAIAPVLETARGRSVGETVLECIRATRRMVRTNTNLGIVLLLAPLAAVAEDTDLRSGVAHLLAALDVQDSRHVYEAIRLAVPGGLGDAPKQDVREEPTLALRDAMALAADRDLIARQYANEFAEIFDDGAPFLRRALDEMGSLEAAIIRTHLHLMADHADTLILRKRGIAEAQESARRARQVLDAGWPHGPEGRDAFTALDAWLRAEGHQRNPGATADVVTACLFVLLRVGTLRLPLTVAW